MVNKLRLLILIIFISSLSYAQVKLPELGATYYTYITKIDQDFLEQKDLQFYTIDFPCLSKLTLEASEEPRIDFELKDESTGESSLINLADGNIMLKGFRMMDPYFHLSEKYIQLIKGIPLINLDSLEDFKNFGSENYFLEYNVSDLPEEMQNWAYVHEYDKLRIKVAVQYETAYKGVESVPLLGGDNYHKLHVNFSQKVSEVKMKNVEWEAIEQKEIPLSSQYFIDFHTEYFSFHQNSDPFGALKIYEQPEMSIEYLHTSKEQNLPLCIDSDEQVYVYPNPSFGKLNVRMISVPEGQYSFDLYNIIGFKVWTTKLQNRPKDLFHLELPDLEKGIYIYSIKDRNGRHVQSRRLTIIEY